MARSAGRPAVYEERYVVALLERIAGGFSVNAACLAQGYRKSTVLGWVASDEAGESAGQPWEGFADRYRRARGQGLQSREDKLGASRDDDLNHRWYLERMDEDLRPPKQKVEHSGAMTIAEITAAEAAAPEDFPDADAAGDGEG